jgi:hypothetical protein
MMSLLFDPVLLFEQLFLLILEQPEANELSLQFVQGNYLTWLLLLLICGCHQRCRKLRLLQRNWFRIYRQWIVRHVSPFLLLDLDHDGTTDLARRRLAIALTNSVVIQYTPAAQAMRRLASLVATRLHVLPQRHHLRAELCLARLPCRTFTRVSEQQETVLLLINHLSLLGIHRGFLWLSAL